MLLKHWRTWLRPEASDLASPAVGRTLVRLAVPAAAASSSNIFLMLFEAIIAGRLGPAPLAGLAIAFPLVITVFAMATGMGTGVTAAIARALGAGDVERARSAAIHGLGLGAVFVVGFTLLAVLVPDGLFRIAGARESTLPHVRAYTRVLFGASAITFSAILCSAILRGGSDMLTPMLGAAVAAFVHLTSAPLLALGWFTGAPLGLRGIALSQAAGGVAGALVIVRRAFASKVRVPLVWRGLRFDAGVLGEIVRVGAPAFCAYGMMTAGIAALTVIVARFGPEASAAYGIGFRLVTMLFIPSMGLSQAALTLVGHLAGGGIFRQARRASWMAIFGTLGGMTLLGVGIALGAAPLARFFTDDPEVLALARRYVQVVGPAVGCAGAAMVVGSCFQGFGRGLPALMLTALRVVGVSIPFAYLFGVVAGLGPAGVWLAVSLSSIATGAAGIGWFALAMRHARRISSRAPSLAPAP